MRIDGINGISYTTITGKRISNMKDASKAFEAIFWGEVLKESFKSLDEPFFKGKGEFGAYRDIVIWYLSDYISNNYNTNIGKAVYDKFKALEGTTKNKVNLDDNINNRIKDGGV